MASSWLGWAPLLALYLAVRLPFLFLVPMGEAPDEFAHYWVIKFIREHWRLPGAAEVFAGGPSAVYGSLPHLGYIPHLVFTAPFPIEWLPTAERFGSLAAGAFMLLAARQTGRLLFPGSALSAAAVPLAVIFHPQIAFLHSYANNDATSSAIASVLLWLTLESIRSGISMRRSATIGLLTGWLTITKYAGLAVMPSVALGLLAACRVHGLSLAAALPSLVMAASLAVVVSSWWFLRTASEFPGDFMGTRTMYKTWAVTFNRELDYYLSPWKIVKDLRWWRMTFFSFWGLFGYMSKYLWRPIYLVYVGIAVVSVAGALTAATAGLKGKAKGALHRGRPSAEPSSTEEENGGPVNQPDTALLQAAPASGSSTWMWTCVALVPIFNVAAMVWASIYNLGGPQGRYLFTSEVALMALLVGGLGLWGPRAGRTLVTAFLIYNALVCIHAFCFLAQSYGGFRLSPL